MTTLIQNSQYIKDIITNSTEPFFIGRIAGIELKIPQTVKLHITIINNVIELY